MKISLMDAIACSIVCLAGAVIVAGGAGTEDQPVFLVGGGVLVVIGLLGLLIDFSTNAPPAHLDKRRGFPVQPTCRLPTSPDTIGTEALSHAAQTDQQADIGERRGRLE